MGRWLVRAFAAFMVLLVTDSAGNWGASTVAEQSADAATVEPPVPYPPNYSTALADTDRALATARARANEDDGWLAQEMLARAHFERARLTGSIDDYVAADQALARSAAQAPPGTGPHLLKAAFELSVHRLGPAEAQLDIIDRYAVPPSAHERAEIAAMRGDLALYRGRYDDALHYYDLADRLSPGSTGFRRAHYHFAMGDMARAINALDRAEQRSPRRSVQLAARTELQRGLFALEAGELVRARRHFLRADALFPGDWLIEEHIAEALSLSGEEQEAEVRYRDIVSHTQDPEFMDQLARLAHQRNAPGEARRWAERAETTWRRRLALFPEAFYGHAAEHCMAARKFACAIRLAQLNYRSRPYGEAAALLAEALESAGRDREARQIFANLQDSRWRSARTRRLAARLASSR